MITPSGTLNELPFPSTVNSPYGITTGPDGNIWFTDYSGNEIGRVNLTGGSPTSTPTFNISGFKINTLRVAEYRAGISLS